MLKEVGIRYHLSMFKRVKRTEVYKDEWVAFYQDEIELPDGTKGTYALVNRKNGVGIVVVTTDNRILLNKEYRYVINDYSWEIPGGGIDEEETPEQAAVRELYEETGISVESLEKIGVFYPLNSFNTETVIIFSTRIEPSVPTTSKSELSEHVAEQRYVSFAEALAMIDNGEINDVLTANALQMVIRKLQK
jgi:ADP-ribose pyrophosphatase